METVIIYYSSNGSTEYVAEKLAKTLSIPKSNILNVSKIKSFNLKPFKNIILGCSTWNVNELPYEFERFLLQIKHEDLKGISIAIFGTGNQKEYHQSFVNAIGLIHEVFIQKECKLVGKVPIQGYSFSSSKAQQGDKFLGLPIDEETQGELTLDRIKSWGQQLKNEFALAV